MATGVACGKLILLGEHAVVYGVPALALGVQLGVTATAAATTGASRLRLLDSEVAAGEEELGRAFAALLAVDEAYTDPISVTVTGDLPPGVGMGFSATAGVAVARAVEALAGRTPTAAVVRQRATAWERVFHGNPSGVDVEAALAGGCIRFERRGEDVHSRPVTLGQALPLAVGLTGTRSSTKEMVSNVAALHRSKPDVVERSLTAIRALVDNAETALADGRLADLGELMNMNQMLLAGWMLSTEAIEALCGSAREHGALGAKLTGAGGGGAVVALLPDLDAGAAVVAAWRELGYEGFTTRVEPR